MEDGTGVTTFSYDAIGRAQVINYPAGKTITYSYDAVGNRAALADPDGGVTTYSYDSRNLLSWLVNPFGERTTWVYDALGRVTTMTHGNLSLAQHDYDAAGRLTALRNLKSDASVISIFTYSYDSVGNRSGAAEANGDIVTWSYDETYQLTREQRSGANAYDVTYSYDAVGNRLIKIEGGAAATYTYDAANQLNTSEDSSGLTTFTYDANGNTIGEVRPNADRVTYTWDIENRMTRVELPSNVVNTITLDGEGKRRSIEDSAGLRNLIWDLENILVETDSNDATAAAYTLAPEAYGELVSQRRSGTTSFHHFDALGSTNKLTDSSANTLAEYLYRAFGQQTVLSGSSANRFTWVGKLGYYRQPDASDYWVRARIMKPGIGRWLTGAQIIGEPNQYLYMQNSASISIDPSGVATHKVRRVGSIGGSNQHCRNLLQQARGALGMGPMGCGFANDRLYDFRQQCMHHYDLLGGFSSLLSEYHDKCRPRPLPPPPGFWLPPAKPGTEPPGLPTIGPAPWPITIGPALPPLDPWWPAPVIGRWIRDVGGPCFCDWAKERFTWPSISAAIVYCHCTVCYGFWAIKNMPYYFGCMVECVAEQLVTGP
jgi:YD repeat-containing protein